MSIRDVMASQLRRIPGILGETTAQYRTKTSTPGVEPPTWNAYASLPAAHISGEMEDITYDERQRTDRRMIVAMLSTPDTVAELPIGTEILRADGTVWAIIGKVPKPAGQRAYKLGRELPRQIAADRGGRVK